MRDCVVGTIVFIIIFVFLAISLQDQFLHEFNKQLRPSRFQDASLHYEMILPNSQNYTIDDEDEDRGENYHENEFPKKVAKPVSKVSKWSGKKTSILIVSAWKSGAALLEEMFNRNPNFMFYSEPLVAFGKQGTDSQKLKMLKDIFQCTVPLAKNYLTVAKDDDMKTCLERGICNDFKSQKFCSPPFCSSKAAKSASTCHESCKINWEETETQELASDNCKKSHAVVASVTLLQELMEIKKFINYQEIHLKVIFLMRDPRSVFRSRKLEIIKNEGKAVWTPARSKHEASQLKKECSTMVDNYNMAVRNKGDIAKSILFLRYEDLSLDYECFIEEIYEKFKLGDFNEAVENLQKIRQYVKPWRTNSDSAIEKLSHDHILYSWRMVNKESSGSQYASQLEILDVQQKCSEFMKTFGYLPLEKETHKSFFNMRLDLSSYETILRNFTFDQSVSL